MFNIGSVVRVLPPFAQWFPGERDVTEIVRHDDGQVVYILGEAGGFDQIYLEAA